MMMFEKYISGEWDILPISYRRARRLARYQIKRRVLLALVYAAFIFAFILMGATPEVI
jgi:hypothetical protein